MISAYIYSYMIFIILTGCTRRNEANDYYGDDMEYNYGERENKGSIEPIPLPEDYHCSLKIGDQQKQCQYVRHNYGQYSLTTTFSGSRLVCEGLTIHTDILKEDEISNNPLSFLISTYRECTSVIDIVIRNSNIPNIPSGLFYNFDKYIINRVILIYNNIESIQPTVFKRLPYLSHLDISHNNIINIEQLMFNTMGYLQSFIIRDNKLTETEFQFPKNLTYVDLSVNDITSINITSDYLSFLNVSSNKISSLDHSMFSRLPLLEKLILNHNLINEISSGTFDALKNLIVLDLSHNLLSEIKLGIFTSLHNLKELKVNDNKLTNLNINAFHDFFYLKFLDISNNLLMSLDSSLLVSVLPNLQNVSVHDNPWNCQVLINLSITMKTKGIMITPGHSRSNSTIHGIDCLNNTNYNTKTIENSNIVPIISNTAINSTSSNTIDFSPLQNFIKALENSTNEMKLFYQRDFKLSKFYNFFNEDHQQTKFFKYFNSDFKNDLFFKFFTNVVLNDTMNKLLQNTEFINNHKVEMCDIEGIIKNVTREMQVLLNTDMISEKQSPNAEKFVSDLNRDCNSQGNSSNIIIVITSLQFILLLIIMIGGIYLIYIRHLKKSLNTENHAFMNSNYNSTNGVAEELEIL